ncbi:MAG TPA: 30S ribosomal protein S4 [Longimicrobium sp.]|nr:30S ribosomal protein S4 [Longimicrobium sp.]
MPERGPRLRHIRRFGTPLPGLSRKEPDWKQYPPGQHGQGGQRRKKQSEYGRQLMEKQKLRLNYGVSERQLRNYLARALHAPGVTGESLLALLERRLDNVVFRLGIAPTIPSARQLVGHGHVRVNGKKVDRSGYLVEVGDVVTVSDKARDNPGVIDSVQRGPQVRLPGFLALDPSDKFTGRVVTTPSRPDVPLVVDEAAVVEFYAR